MRIMLLVWLVVCAPAFAQTVDRDISYGSDPLQQIDLYHAPVTGPAKLVVFVHGGGWIGGNKRAARQIAPALVQQGYAVASIGYRSYPQVPLTGMLQDTANGIAYLLHHAARFGIDPSRFAIIGHSSGAHMVAVLGTDAGYFARAGVDPHTLAAVVPLDGVFDIGAEMRDYPQAQREGVFGADPAAWKLVSPVDLLGSMTAHPRFCLVHEDTNARFVEQEELFEAALKKRGEPVRVVTAHGLTHGDLVTRFADPAEPMLGFTLGCLAGR